MPKLADYPRAQKLARQPFKNGSSRLADDVPQVANEAATMRQRRQREADIKYAMQLFDQIRDDMQRDEVLLLCFKNNDTKIGYSGRDLYRLIQTANNGPVTLYLIKKKDM